MSNYAYFVGIDWADRKHDVAIVNEHGKLESLTVLEHSSEAIEALISQLLARSQGRPIAIMLEQSKGALINTLVLRENVILFPINPKQLSAYRQSFQNTSAKNDKQDAQLLVRLLFERHTTLRAWVPDDEQTRMLNRLCQARRHWVEERTSVAQRLLNLLKCYFPALLCLADSRLYQCPLLLKLLSKWPDPRQLKRQNPATLRTLFEQFGYKNASRRDELIGSIRQAELYTKDLTLLQCAALEAKLLAGHLELLASAIEELDEQIRQIMASHPDAELFCSLRGAGAALAPRLITAFGSDRSKFEHAEQVACYSGIAPVTKQSGKSCSVTRRYACNKYMRQTFHEFASAAAKWCPWSKAFYNMHKAQGVKRHAILRKLAYKWIRILFRCWKTRTHYDPQRYIETILRTSPNIRNFFPKNAKIT